MITIREFRIDDYVQARQLWESTDGVGLSEADSMEAIARFLVRNPSLSFVALDDGHVVGTILCGHDGRRGLIHHLVVSSERRRQGLGRTLVHLALSGLESASIQKCHLLVFRHNVSGQAFWRRIGGEERVSVVTFSLLTSTSGGEP